MLKLKHKHHIDFPYITFTPLHSMALSEVSLDTDELAQAIVNDPIDHDDNWQLTENTDTEELEQYWATVEEEIKNDPEWVDFAKEQPDSMFL